MQRLIVVSCQMFVLVSILHGFVCKEFVLTCYVIIGHLESCLWFGSGKLLEV